MRVRSLHAQSGRPVGQVVMDTMRVVLDEHDAESLAENRVRWQTGAMNTKTFIAAVATVASTGFGPAAVQGQKPADAAHVVVYKSPT